MALTFTSLLLFLTFIYTVSSQLQPSYSQYFQYPPAPSPYPSSPSYAPSLKPLPESPPVYRPPPLPSQFPSYPSPPVQPPPPRFNLPPVPLSPPILSPPPLTPLPALTPCDGPKPPKCPSSSDAEVINNLAIALQSSFNPPTGFPNANFIGSSSYGDSGSLVTSFGNPYGPPPKPCSRCLMSPYEAIDTNRDFVTMDFY
ncbi:hypothetical protein JYU34_001218 [Plutella xylostella]|uniref:Uncharacterized protein n=1 Tax=Plutella xylostella TaxID=51655 RepID=A0ABQ7R6A7_PLUXY|nr:hypothetical protein JYU34_001218 [Plutella xylostella]